MKPVERKLATFRVLVPKRFADEAKFGRLKQDPLGYLKVWTGGPQVFHSTMGWKEVPSAEGPGFVLLRQILETDEKFVQDALACSGKDGVFVEQMAFEMARRAPVRWIPQVEGESPRAYFARVSEMQSKEKALSLAFRSGGKAQLGLRFKDGHVMDDHAMTWRATGVPTEWFAEGLTSTLLGADWKDVEVIGFRHRVWTPRGKNPRNSQSGCVWNLGW